MVECFTIPCCACDGQGYFGIGPKRFWDRSCLECNGNGYKLVVGSPPPAYDMKPKPEPVRIDTLLTEILLELRKISAQLRAPKTSRLSADDLYALTRRR